MGNSAQENGPKDYNALLDSFQQISKFVILFHSLSKADILEELLEISESNDTKNLNLSLNNKTIKYKQFKLSYNNEYDQELIKQYSSKLQNLEQIGISPQFELSFISIAKLNESEETKNILFDEIYKKLSSETNSVFTVVVSVDKKEQAINFLKSKKTEIYEKDIIQFVTFIHNKDSQEKIFTIDDISKELKPQIAEYEEDKIDICESGGNIFDIYKIFFRNYSFFNELGDQFTFPFKPNSELIKEENNYFDFFPPGNESIGSFNLIGNDKERIHNLNFLICGDSGTGKSTFCNFLLQKRRAKAGVQEKNGGISKFIVKYQCENTPWVIYDSPGFEPGKAGQKFIDSILNLIKYLNKELHDARMKLHVIIYVLNDSVRRIQEEILKEIEKYKVPTLILINKATIKNGKWSRETLLFREETKKKMKKIFGVNFIDALPVDIKKREGVDEMFKVLFNFYKNDKVNENEPDSYKNSRLFSEIKSPEALKTYFRENARNEIKKHLRNCCLLSFIPFANKINKNEFYDLKKSVINAITVSLIKSISKYYGKHISKQEAEEQAAKILSETKVKTNIEERKTQNYSKGFVKYIPIIGIPSSIYDSKSVYDEGNEIIQYFENKLGDSIGELVKPAIKYYNKAVDELEKRSKIYEKK